MDRHERILSVGSVPIRKRTNIVHHVSANSRRPTRVPFGVETEWRGSYADLQTHRLGITVG